MSSTSKVVTTIIVIIVVIIGILWLMGGSANTTVPVITATPYVSQSQAPQSNQNNGSSISASNTSDAALNSDFDTVDTNMSALNSDNASVDQGMKDTPVPQAQ